MASPISRATATCTIRSTFQSCTTYLRSLVQKIKNAIADIFQCLFPCLFSSAQPAQMRAVTTQVAAPREPRADRTAPSSPPKELNLAPTEVNFSPYELAFEDSEGNELSYSVTNQETESATIQEIQQWMNENHRPLRIRGGIKCEILCRLEKYARVRRVFAEQFDLSRKPNDSTEYLNPKSLVEELGEGLRRIRYPNGIEEEARLSDGVWETISRSYPDGKIEKGKFDRHGELYVGSRFSEGEYEFFHPQYMHSAPTFLSGRFYGFAEVEIEGEKQVALLENINGSWRLSSANPLQVLFHAAQASTIFFSIRRVIGTSSNFISAQNLVDYAFSRGEDGQPRIFLLNDADVLTILEEAQKLSVGFDFHKPSPVTNQTLFAQHLVYGQIKLIQCMLAMDPTCIEQMRGPTGTLIRQILSTGSRHQAEKLNLLKEAMREAEIPLPESVVWAERIYRGDLSFADQDFVALDAALQKELYQIAHACSHLELVARMNNLGMKQQPLPPRGPTPLSINMDLVEQRRAIELYLLELREKGRLLLSEEAPPNLKDFHRNYNDFSRVAGADFVKKTVQRLGLQHIDAAETFAILKPGAPSISIKIDRDICVQSDEMDIYAEKIVEVDRFISLAEAYELLDVIEATGFGDIHHANFMVTQDKIYFVDLESSNFEESAAYGLMGRLLPLVKPEDRETLLANMNERREVLLKTEEDHQIDLEAKAAFEEECKKTLFCGRSPHTFPIASIVK